MWTDGWNIGDPAWTDGMGRGWDTRVRTDMCSHVRTHTHTCVGVSGVGSWSAALDDGTMIASGVTDLASPWPAAEGGSGATSVS